MTEIDYNEAAAGISATNAIRDGFSHLEPIFIKPRLTVFEETILGYESVVWQTAAQSAYMLTPHMLAFRLAAAGQKTLCLFRTFMRARTFANEMCYHYSAKTGSPRPPEFPQILVEDNDNEGTAISTNASSGSDPDADILVHVATYATVLKTNVHEEYDAVVLMDSEETGVTCNFFYEEDYRAPTMIHVGISDSPHSVALLSERDMTHYVLHTQASDISPEAADVTYTVEDTKMSLGQSKKHAVQETARLIKDGHKGIFMMFGDSKYSIRRIQEDLESETDIPIKVFDVNDHKTNVPPTEGTKVIVGTYFQIMGRLKPFYWLTAGVCDGFEKNSVTLAHMSRKSSHIQTIQQWYINKAVGFVHHGKNGDITPEFVVFKTPTSFEDGLKESPLEKKETVSFFHGLTSAHLTPNKDVKRLLSEKDLERTMAMGIVDENGLTELGTRIMNNRGLAYCSHVFMTHVLNHPKVTNEAISCALPIAALLNVRSMYHKSVRFPTKIHKNDPPFDSSIIAEVNVFLHYGMKKGMDVNKLPKSVRDIPSPLVEAIMPVPKLYETVLYCFWSLIHLYLTMDDQKTTQSVINDIYDVYLGDKQHVLSKKSDVSNVIKSALMATFIDNFYVCSSDRKAVRDDTDTPLSIPNLNVYDGDLVCGFPYHVNEKITLLTRPTTFEFSEVVENLKNHPFLHAVDNGDIQVVHTATGTVVATIEEDISSSSDDAKLEGPMAEKMKTAMGI